MKAASLFLCLFGFATSQALTIQRDGEIMPSPPWPIEPDVRGEDDPMPIPPWPIEPDVRGEDEPIGPPPIKDPEDRSCGSCGWATWNWRSDSFCNYYKSYCNSSYYGPYMLNNCERTCCC